MGDGAGGNVGGPAGHAAQELSRLPATDGKERSHGDGFLPLREVRLEGLGDLIQLPGGAAS